MGIKFISLSDYLNIFLSPMSLNTGCLFLSLFTRNTVISIFLVTLSKGICCKSMDIWFRVLFTYISWVQLQWEKYRRKQMSSLADLQQNCPNLIKNSFLFRNALCKNGFACSLYRQCCCHSLKVTCPVVPFKPDYAEFTELMKYFWYLNKINKEQYWTQSLVKNWRSHEWQHMLYQSILKGNPS